MDKIIGNGYSYLCGGKFIPFTKVFPYKEQNGEENFGVVFVVAVQRKHNTNEFDTYLVKMLDGKHSKYTKEFRDTVFTCKNGVYEFNTKYVGKKIKIQMNLVSEVVVTDKGMFNKTEYVAKYYCFIEDIIEKDLPEYLKSANQIVKKNNNNIDEIPIKNKENKVNTESVSIESSVETTYKTNIVSKTIDSCVSTTKESVNIIKPCNLYIDFKKYILTEKKQSNAVAVSQSANNIVDKNDIANKEAFRSFFAIR